jgi:pimeloyl-ACP methyl ester carboxylesterase
LRKQAPLQIGTNVSNIFPTDCGFCQIFDQTCGISRTSLSSLNHNDAGANTNSPTDENSGVEDKFVVVNGVRLHYLDHPGEEGPIVFLHGLSANAHSFDQLVRAGLMAPFRVLALDLRGRGLSEKPPTGYSVAEHASDVVEWLNTLRLHNVILVGHSYGAFLASYVAAHNPDRVRKLILLDIFESGARSSRVVELLRPSLGRLGRSWSSPAEYISEMRQAPHLSRWWDAAMEQYFLTDVEEGTDGRLRSRARVEAVSESAQDSARLDWAPILAGVTRPSLLLHALEPFGSDNATPLVLSEEAKMTAAAMPDCRCLPVPGNHITMLFGAAAGRVGTAISEFIFEPARATRDH